MEKIKIHVLRTGEVRVSPYLPFGGDDCSIIKASGITTPKSKWIWLPVFSFLIEHPKGLVLFDTGWHREMSPDGVYDKKAHKVVGFVALISNQPRSYCKRRGYQ